MRKNFNVDKSVLSYIQAKKFWPEGVAEQYRRAISSMKKVGTPWGWEVENFNMVDPQLDMIFSEMLGDNVEMSYKNSGIFRVPYKGIHHDPFYSLNEWRFFIALEDIEFTIYNHKSGAIDARYVDPKDYDKVNLKNSLEWNIESILFIKQNDSLFYRPWVFHSFSPGLIQYFHLNVIEED